MAIASVVIGENAQHLATTTHLLTGVPLFSRCGRWRADGSGGPFRQLGNQESLISEVRDHNDKDVDEFLHKCTNLTRPESDGPHSLLLFFTRLPTKD